MATYTDPSTLNTDPNDPVTSELMTAAIDNPVAIAEGAAGAARIQPEALGTFLASGTTTASATDLADVGWVLAGYMGSFSAPSGESATATLAYALSTNNGSSYGTTVTLLSEQTSGTSTVNFSGTVLVPLSGLEDAVQFSSSLSVTGGGGGGTLNVDWSVLGIGRK